MIRDLGLALQIALATLRGGLRGRLSLLLLASLGTFLLLGSLFRRFQDNRALEMRLVLEGGMALSVVLVLGTALLLASRGLTRPEETSARRVLLSLPMNRNTVLLGHLFGTLILIFLYTLGMGLALLAVMRWRFGVWQPGLPIWALTLYVEAVVLVLVTTLFSTLGSGHFAFLAGGGWALMAHAEGTLRHLAAHSGNSFLEGLIRSLILVLPALESLSVRTEVVRELPIALGPLAVGIAHCLGYSLVVYGATSWALGRREF